MRIWLASMPSFLFMPDNARIPKQRKHVIRDRLVGGAAVMSTDLAAEFGVSEDAIRRDLRALAAEGVCERVYGGALPLSPATGALTERVLQNTEEKAALALAALQMIRAGQTLFLDSSSSNLELARILPIGAQLHVITNCLAIASELMSRGDIVTSLVGGRLSTETGGCVDAKAIHDLQEYSIDLAFVGACAFEPIEGLAGYFADDVQFKKALIRSARATAVLLTTDKIATTAPYRICASEAITTYILPHSAAERVGPALSKLGRQFLSAPIWQS